MTLWLFILLQTLQLLNAKHRNSSVAPAPLGTYVECYECGKRFTGDYMVYTLRRHEATVHRGQFPHKCPVCGKGMQGIEDLRSHLVSKHKMPSDYRCDLCNEDFCKKRTLHLHMLTKHSLVPCVKQWAFGIFHDRIFFYSFGFNSDTLSSDMKMWYINKSILYTVCGLCIWWLWAWSIL